MKILVISDTHGRLEKAQELIEKKGPFDLVVHLGDLEEDARILARRTGAQIRCVKGNMDGGTREDAQVLSTSFGDILLVHGHIQGVKNGLMNIVYAAGEKNCRAVFFGHTHVPLLEESQGIYLLNPGSLTLPHLADRGSYAIVEIEKEQMHASILYV